MASLQDLHHLLPPSQQGLAGKHILLLGPTGAGLSLVSHYLTLQGVRLTVLSVPRGIQWVEPPVRLLEGGHPLAEDALLAHLETLGSPGVSVWRVLPSTVAALDALVRSSPPVDAVVDLNLHPLAMQAVVGFARERHVPTILCSLGGPVVEVLSVPPGRALPADWQLRYQPMTFAPLEILGAGLALTELHRSIRGAGPQDVVRLRYDATPMGSRFGSDAGPTSLQDIPVISPGRQRRLMVLGAGNLGSSVMACILAGVAHLGGRVHVSFVDRPDESYELRNVLGQPWAMGHLGQPKARVLQDEIITRSGGTLSASSALVDIKTFPDVEALIEEHRPDVMFRCLDSFEATEPVHQASLRHGIPLVFGALSSSGGGVLRRVDELQDCLDCCHVQLKAKVAAPRPVVNGSCAINPVSTTPSGLVIASLMVLEELARGEDRLRGGSILLEVEEGQPTRLGFRKDPERTPCGHFGSRETA